MSIITSDKFDISTLSKDTQYVVDTNVLYFIHSGYKVSKHKSTTYSNIVSTILNQGCKLIISTLSVQELLHIIEKKNIEYSAITMEKIQNIILKRILDKI